MNHPSEADLLGYVLGALDAQEQRDLQEQIDQNPEIEDRLLAIKSDLVPLDLLESVGHRPGLARRTCEAVFQTDAEERRRRLAFLEDECLSADHHSESGVGADPDTQDAVRPARRDAGQHSPAPHLSPSKSSFRGRVSSWSLTDFVAAVAMLAVLASLAFPVVAHTRSQARLVACQDNLQRLGQGALLYGDLHRNDGELFTFPSEGNLSVVGSFALALKESGLIDDAWLDCPGSSLFEKPLVPARNEVEQASDPVLIEQLQRMLGGDYGFSMGHVANGRFVIAAGRAGLDYTVLAGDRPSPSQLGRASLSHGGALHNILLASGAVVGIRGHVYGEDDLYANDYGWVAPGIGPRDNVIAPSQLSPVKAMQLVAPSSF